MFCMNCGAANQDGAKFCADCGAELQTPVQEAPVQAVPETPEAPVAPVQAEAYEAPAAPEQAASEQAPAGDQAKEIFNTCKEKVTDFISKATEFCKNYLNAAKQDKKLLIAPAAGATGLIAIIVVLAIVFSSPYKKPMDNVVKLLLGKGNEKTISALVPKDGWEYLEDELDVTAEDLADMYDEYADELVEGMEDALGENVRIKYKITDKDKLSSKELKEIKNALNDMLDIKKKDVKKGYILEVEGVIKGRDDEEELDLEVTVVKIGGKWYIVGFGMDGLGSYDVSDLDDLADLADMF